MTWLFSIGLILFLALLLVRRLVNRRRTNGSIALELLLTTALSTDVALLLWWGLQPTTVGFTLLLWAAMFVSGVLGIRTMGRRLVQLRQLVADPHDLHRFTQALAYHAATLWQLALIIGLATSAVSRHLPAPAVLWGLSLVITVAILLENAVRLANLPS